MKTMIKYKNLKNFFKWNSAYLVNYYSAFLFLVYINRFYMLFLRPSMYTISYINVCASY